MFVGHAALAFALVGLGGLALGRSREQALLLGVIAALAATLPDLDVLYALPTLLAGTGMAVPVEAFWDGAAAHRSLTHSLLVALPIATGIGLVAGKSTHRVGGVGIALLTGGVLISLPEGEIVVIAPFILGALALGAIAHRTPVPWPAVTVVAAIGLLSHPFGDLVTGDPPWLLYPAGLEVVTGRVTLAADPTLHLLGAFFLELGAIWLGLFTYARLHETTLKRQIHPRAALGALFAGSAFLIPSPTLETSYQFVFGVLAVGGVGFMPRKRREPLPWIVTGLAAITLAGLSYTGTYLVLGP